VMMSRFWKIRSTRVSSKSTPIASFTRNQAN
jgi:hypothetical protein